MPGVNDPASRGYKIAVMICRYANGGCLCAENQKPLCAGPKQLALQIMALPSLTAKQADAQRKARQKKARLSPLPPGGRANE